MITETGGNLSVLITTETGKDWETFATWYSIYKNLPDAKVAVTCVRNGETPFHYFQWAKRLNLKVIHHDPFDSNNQIASRLDSVRKAITAELITSPVLVVNPLVMTIDVLDKNLLELFDSHNRIFDNEVWFLKEPNVADMLNELFLKDNSLETHENKLCVEAKTSQNIQPIVSYRKGCGKWIDTLKGCPFSNANGLITLDMTPNENRIVELWKKMCTLYSVVI